MSTQDIVKTLRRTAIQKLARREHSRKELRQALKIKYPDAESSIDPVLDQLIEGGYLDETRFTEAYVRYRRERGYGPVRIQLELEERGVPEELIEQYLDKNDPVWVAQKEKAREKRFGGSLPKDFTEKARQLRFLQYRGF